VILAPVFPGESENTYILEFQISDVFFMLKHRFLHLFAS
jgi:hypothetical protein